MSYDAIQALPLGQTSTSAFYDAHLGRKLEVAGVTYRLMKSKTAVTAAQNNVCIFTVGSANSWHIGAISGAAALRGTVAGIPQLPSADLADETYCWVARAGLVTATTAAAIAAGKGLATHGAAGAVDDTTVTYETQIGFATDAIGSATTGTILLALE
jgi:hypothetical protein